MLNLDEAFRDKASSLESSSEVPVKSKKGDFMAYRGRELDSNKNAWITSSMYISYNLLLEGSELESISISHV